MGMYPLSLTPSHMRWEPSSAVRGSQQVLPTLHKLAVVLSSSPGTAQLAMALLEF